MRHPFVIRHAFALAAVSAVLLTAALASPGHALILALGMAGGPVLKRYLHPDGPPAGAVAAQPASATRPLLDDVLDALAQPVLLVDGRGNVVLVNTAARRAFPALSAGEPLAFAVRSPQLIDAVNGTLSDGAGRTVEVLERIPVERAFTAAIERLAPRGPAEASAAIILRETSKERAVEAMRADFVANASHELRTPLASIIGFVETLRGAARDDAPAREKFLAIIYAQARRMARLIDDLLSLSRIELKEHIAPTGSVDLAQIVDDVALTLSELARDRGVELAVSTFAAPAMALGDHDEIASAVENLVENAIKYGKSGKRVEITLADLRPGRLRLSVRDFGPGIPQQSLPRMTERFYRIDSALSRAEGGTGLGLALVKHTVNRHRGRLEIESTMGVGTTVTVELRKAAPDVS